MSDYAADLGTFICCSDYSVHEAHAVLRSYFGREPASSELAHCFGYVALASYYWYLWALYQKQNGNAVGRYEEMWKSYAIEYGKLAKDLYEGGE